IAWADALVLSHREASQSGAAAAAITAGRWVVATRVGGIAEQLEGEHLARMCEPSGAALSEALRSLIESPPAPGRPPAPGAEGMAVSEQMASDLRDAMGQLGRR